jgi:protein SCO1/2
MYELKGGVVTLNRGLRLSAVLAWLAASTFAVAVAGCGRTAGSAPARIEDPATASQTSGDALNPPIVMPAAKLTDEHGRAYDVRARTAGRVTLMFFGYTHCKDVCPTTMADITAAVHKLPTARRRQVSVLFVTADPWRDTPARLRSWVGGFDPAFTGLTGDYARLRAFAKACGVYLDVPADRTGDYEVQHGSQTLIFGRDQKAHALFTADPDSDALSRDVARTLAGRNPS